MPPISTKPRDVEEVICQEIVCFRWLSGLTLIELLIVLTLMSVVTLMSAPMFLAIYQKNQLEITKNELGAVIRYARNKALEYHVSLILAPVPPLTDWSKGMILFIDNKNHKYSAGDQLLYQWGGAPDGIQVSWRGFFSNDYLRFSPELREAATSGHFDLINAHSSHCKLIVNRIGRVTEQTSC